MAGSGCAVWRDVVVSVFWKIKKGPRGPMHTARFSGWPQPSPAVRLGTTTIRSLVILLRISWLGLLKGCADHTGQAGKVKANPTIALTRRIAGFAASGEHFHRHSGTRPGIHTHDSS